MACPCQKDEDEEDNNVSAMQVIQKDSTVDINDAHMLLRHIGKKLLEKSAKLIGWTLTGTLTTCDACAKAKAKAKGVTKKVAEPASKPGERLDFDIAGPYSTSLGGSTYWVMAVDDHSRYKYSGFMKKKSDIGDFAEEVFKKVQAAGHTIKYVRCDNAGENIRHLQDACEKEMGITMEYTAPYTLEQNGVVERAFANVRTMGYAMMLNASFRKEAQGLLWTEVMNATTSLANITATST